MAYVSQEDKKNLAPAIKTILKNYGLKGSLSIRHHSTLVLTIKSGTIDFCEMSDRLGKKKAEWEDREFYPCDGTIQVNEYHIESHFEGKAAECLKKLKDALEGPDFFCEDDAMTDYFHRSHYIDINIGRWNKPYILEAK
jgi:hypothetical protein